MPRPHPTWAYHFTHVDHLASIVTNGLLADSQAHAAGRLSVEVGNQAIKQNRRRRAVPLEPGGVVADYVPFYFAPRSPMMYVIHRGGVPTYDGGCDDLIYLVTSVEALVENGSIALYTDRNAVLEVTDFRSDVDSLDELVDWGLMSARMWNDTSEHPDRKERRMAECLVHERVPWDAMVGIACRTRACADVASRTLASLGQRTPIRVRPGWYF